MKLPIHCFKNRTGPAGPTGSTGSQSGPVNTPKTGQQPVKNRKTGQKPGKNRVEPEIKKKTVWCPVRFLKPCPHLTSTYTYVMIIAQRVHSDKASQFLRYYKYVTKLKYIQRDNLTYLAILYTFLVPKFHSNLLYTFFFLRKKLLYTLTYV